MREALITCLAIAIAGAAGALLRYALSTQIGRFNLRFPLGTFIINITGSAFLGWFYAYVVRHGVSDLMKLAIGTGFVGAYTTFSTWMYESNRLAEEGAYILAAVNLIGSLVVGILAVRAGIMLGSL